MQVHISFGEVRWEPVGHVEEVHSFGFSGLPWVVDGC